MTPDSVPRIVVMGVSGAGKSSVGAQLAGALGVTFVDADDLHPLANVEKMAAGIPLTDEDRRPWLAEVGEALAASSAGIVMACSALRRRYRDQIRSAAPQTVFVHLAGTHELLASRLSGREDHFMPAALLDSQESTLEPLEADERGVVVDITPSLSEVVREIVAQLSALEAPEMDDCH